MYKRQVLGEVKLDPGIVSENTKVPPKAPGMRYRHYAPKADMTLVEGNAAKVVAKINQMAEQAKSRGYKVGIVATEETKASYRWGEVVSIGSREDEAEVAHHLYRVLRKFDELGVDVIYSESFDTAGVGQAVMNRLLKAAGHKRVTV